MGRPGGGVAVVTILDARPDERAPGKRALPPCQHGIPRGVAGPIAHGISSEHGFPKRAPRCAKASSSPNRLSPEETL